MTLNFLAPRVTARQRAFVVRQLAVLLSSGVPLATALSLASQQSDNDLVRQALKAINKDVEQGVALSAAVGKFPVIFDSVMVSLIKSGEASGHLQQVLTDMADQLEKDAVFATTLRNALLYPAFIVSVMIVVGIIMTTFIIPRLASVFEDTNLNLPWTTRLVIGVSSFMIHYWYILIVVVGVAFVLARSFLKSDQGRAWYYHIQMRIPVVKNLVEGSYLARFSRILGLLIRAGVPITEALQLVSDSLGNQLYSAILISVRGEVERGIPLSTALARHDLFPKPLTQMLAVGEQTGKLEDVLANLAKTYEEQTNAAVAAITALIEPTILVVVAIAAGIVVVSVILPIYGIAEQF